MERGFAKFGAKVNQMPAPPPLRRGDLVAITCPARKATRDDLAHAVELLESWGLRVRLGATVGAVDRQFGGPDALRAEDLGRQLADPEVRAVFCARGGYGCARLLPLLDPAPLRADPKWLVGFSDVTALLAWADRQTDVATLHAPMPCTFAGTTPEALEHLRQHLFGRRPGLAAGAHPLNRAGRARGRLVGGNLSVLYSLRGTPGFPDLNGAVLFLEDLDEYRYHVDRMALNFSLGGLWSGLAGLAVGGLTDMRDNAVPFGREAADIVAEHAAGFPFPVGFGLPAGHVADNRALLFGEPVTLTVDGSGARLDWEA
jgi:muramoyltetrapeptide carboxypeptidase